MSTTTDALMSAAMGCQVGALGALADHLEEIDDPRASLVRQVYLSVTTGRVIQIGRRRYTVERFRGQWYRVMRHGWKHQTRVGNYKMLQTVLYALSHQK